MKMTSGETNNPLVVLQDIDLKYTNVFIICFFIINSYDFKWIYITNQSTVILLSFCLCVNKLLCAIVWIYLVLLIINWVVFIENMILHIKRYNFHWIKNCVLLSETCLNRVVFIFFLFIYNVITKPYINKC